MIGTTNEIRIETVNKSIVTMLNFLNLITVLCLSKRLSKRYIIDYSSENKLCMHILNKHIYLYVYINIHYK